MSSLRYGVECALCGEECICMQARFGMNGWCIESDRTELNEVIGKLRLHEETGKIGQIRADQHMGTVHFM